MVLQIRNKMLGSISNTNTKYMLLKKGVTLHSLSTREKKIQNTGIPAPMNLIFTLLFWFTSTPDKKYLVLQLQDAQLCFS